MNLQEFLKAQPQIRNTVLQNYLVLQQIDLAKLSKEIDKSPSCLKKYKCLGWLIKNYDRIIRGDFRTYASIYQAPRDVSRAPLFGTERHYTKEELDGLMDDIDTINLSGDDNPSPEPPKKVYRPMKCAPLFGTERHYTKEELDALIDEHIVITYNPDADQDGT